MKAIGTIAVVGALVASLTIPSADASAAKIGEPGGYIGGGVGIGFDNFDTGPSFDTGVGMDSWLGFRVNGHFGVEGQFQWLPGFKPDDGSGEIELMSYTANLKFFILKGRFQPHLLAGVGAVTKKSKVAKDESAFAARFGGGIDFYFTQGVALVGTYNYVMPTGSLDDRKYMSVTAGVQFIF